MVISCALGVSPIGTGHASGSRVLISGQIRQPVQAGEASTSWARTSMAHVPALTASARVLLLLLACAAKMLRRARAIDPRRHARRRIPGPPYGRKI